MLNCKETAKLVSEGMDHPLSWRQRLAIRMHLLLCHCPVCRNYSRQMQAFRDAITAYRESLDKDSVDPKTNMPDDCRERILRQLRQQPD